MHSSCKKGDKKIPIILFVEETHRKDDKLETNWSEEVGGSVRMDVWRDGAFLRTSFYMGLTFRTTVMFHVCKK